MKRLIIGTWKWDIHEKVFPKGLEELRHEISRVSFSSFFNGRTGACQVELPLSIPALFRISRVIWRSRAETNPDIVLFGGEHISYHRL